MNPSFRLVALLAAALGLVVSLVVALREDEPQPLTTRPATTSAGTPTVEARPIPAVLDVDARSGDVARLTVERGDQVVLNVTAGVADHVRIHGYDLNADVDPERPARIGFVADVAGTFEVELEKRHVLVAELRVEP